MRILYQFILSLHQFSNFLPWCNSISSLLFLYYLDMFNMYPNIPLIIPTVIRYNIMFPLFFHYFIYILYNNHPLSEPQFYLPLFYPLLIFAIVFLIIFPFIIITPSPARRTNQGKFNILSLPNYHLIHNP